MAADWIKLRVDLMTHPKVVRILSATCTDKFRVIGGLHAVWSVFDTHSIDGKLMGYTPELLDHVIGWEGFARAMESVGWLLYDGLETLALPEFDTHNGQSAKRRADDQKRKKTSRHSVRNLSAEEPDKKRTREEKRREDIKSNTSTNVDVPADQSANPSPPPCPHKAVVALYHEILPELRQVRQWDGDRAKMLAKRWREDEQRQNLDWWRTYFNYVKQSDFLMGRTTGSNGRAFDCDLEWLVRPTNFLKVIEGKYE